MFGERVQPRVLEVDRGSGGGVVGTIEGEVGRTVIVDIAEGEPRCRHVVRKHRPRREPSEDGDLRSQDHVVRARRLGRDEVI